MLLLRKKIDGLIQAQRVLVDEVKGRADLFKELLVDHLREVAYSTRFRHAGPLCLVRYVRVNRRNDSLGIAENTLHESLAAGRAVGLPEGVIDGQDEAVPLEVLGAGAGVVDGVVHQVGGSGP